MSHLSEDEVELFLAARLGPAEQKRAVGHLLAGCGICSRKLVEQAPDHLLEQAADQHRKAAQDSPRERALAAALEQDARWRLDEKKLARSLELFLASPGGYDGLSFRQIQALHGKALVEALLRQSYALRYRDPKAMRWLAYNAVKAAESLRPEEYGPTCPFAVQAQAWAELANAYRANDDLAEAEGAFGRARTLLRRGGGDLRVLARLAAFEASLRSAQRRFLEARELLDRVYRLYLMRGDRHLAGEALVAQGMSVQYGGDSLTAVRVLRKAVVLLDPDRDPQVVSIGQQGLVHALVDCGEYRKAGELLLKSDLRRSFANEPLKLLKLRWLEAKLMLGRGRDADAERALSHVRREFQERGKEYDAALVGLDLLPVRLRQGHAQEMRETAKNIFVTFQALGIRREAATARRYLA